MEERLSKLFDPIIADIVKALAEKEVTAPSNLKVSEIAEYIKKIGG